MLRVWFSGIEEHAARVGAYALDRGLDRLHAQRKERRIEVVESAGEEIGVDRRELEPGVTQVHGRVERDLVLLPLRAQPPLDLGHAVEDAPLEIQQWARERESSMRNHGGGHRRAAAGFGANRGTRRPQKKGRRSRRPEDFSAARNSVVRDQLPISRLAVCGDVETLALLLFRHAQADREIDDLVAHVGDHARPHDGEADRFRLDPLAPRST